MSTILTTTIKANTLLHSDGSTTTAPSIPALDQRMAKAWANFDMSPFSVRNSYNTSSITDAGTGRFQINFTNALPSVNYAWLGLSGNYNNTTTTGRDVTNDGNLSVNSLSGRVTQADNTSQDMDYVAVVVFGS